jgi:hypothetical protein
MPMQVDLQLASVVVIFAAAFQHWESCQQTETF